MQRNDEEHEVDNPHHGIVGMEAEKKKEQKVKDAVEVAHDEEQVNPHQVNHDDFQQVNVCEQEWVAKKDYEAWEFYRTKEEKDKEHEKDWKS